MSIFPYPSDAQLDAAVEHILRTAFTGKDPMSRPKGLVTHQIVQRLPDNIAIPLIEHGGIGGNKGSIGAPCTASQKVMFSLKRLRRKGLVRVRYVDCEGVVYPNRFDKDGSMPYIVPSYPVCGLYEFCGVIVRPVGGTPKVQISLGL